MTSVSGQEICPERPFSIFPNPGHEQFTISLITHTATLQICNNEGKILYNNQIQQGNTQFDCSSYMPGIYLIKVTDKQGKSYTQKWIKQ
jgi:hypothetical protein